MNAAPRKLTLEEWDHRYTALRAAGLAEPFYGGPLRRHLTAERDLRLQRLQFDNSPAALRLWNLLLTENQRLHAARARGETLVGAMKDLGTVPVMAYALNGVRAFYPDGAWWTPCLMEHSDNLLRQAEALGIDASFCPVRAMLAAMVNGEHFPRPDLLICSTGAVCDDFSAIAQRLEPLGFEICWWEVPRRRAPDPDEPGVDLPGGWRAPQVLVDCVRGELEHVSGWLSEAAGQPLTDRVLAQGIRQANEVRRLLADLRRRVYGAAVVLLPALEMLIAEMLALHFCSDREETRAVLVDLIAEVNRRQTAGEAIISASAVRVYWVNPVADLRAMNLLEAYGGRLCGSDYMFNHALDLIPENLPPLDALARVALADPMVGPATDRAARVIAECRAVQAEALVVSRIPGASHCAREGELLRSRVQAALGIPTVEIEIPPVCDALVPTLATRLQALIETARSRRRS